MADQVPQLLVACAISTFLLTGCPNQPCETYTPPVPHLSVAEYREKYESSDLWDIRGEGNPDHMESVRNALGEPHEVEELPENKVRWIYRATDGGTNVNFVDGKAQSAEWIEDPNNVLEKP